MFLLRRLSFSYFRRHPGKTTLALLGIAAGVATFVAVHAAQQALASGLRRTVDRLAGAADLQITAPGGVPETVLEPLDEVPGVAAAQPIIEQVVEPEAAGAGNLLVVGVDLVGDHHVRSYAFAGDDADVDDPLVFLAQPDSIALSQDFAARAGLRKGDPISLRIGRAPRRLTVRALLDSRGFAAAYGGQLAVMDVYAAEDLFGRGRRFDWIDVRLEPAMTAETVAVNIRRAIGAGYRVETPDARGADLERAAASIVSGFDVVTFFALGLGAFLIFNVMAIGVERRRRDIGILRAIGATPVQVTTLFLAEAAVLGAIGGAAGAAIGAPAAAFSRTIMAAVLRSVQGLGDESPFVIHASLIGEGLLAGIAASLVGAWIPARRAARVKPVDATSTGLYAATAEPLPARTAVAGVVLLGAAGLLERSGAVPTRLLLPAVIVTGTLGAIALIGHAAVPVARPFARFLARAMPGSGRIAAHALLGRPRRTAANVAVLTVSAAFVLGTAGYLRAVGLEFDRWAGGVSSDLVVRATPGFGPSDVHLPARVRMVVSDVPGVAAVSATRSERVDFRGRSVTVVALDARGEASPSAYRLIAGPADALSRQLRVDRKCAVSDLFARRFSVGIGDTVDLESPTGEVRLPVAAIVANYRATILVDRSLFVDDWHDDRIDTLDVTLTSGANAGVTRRQIEDRIGSDTPALVLTRDELAGARARALDALDSGIRTTVLIALVAAFAGVGSSLLAAVAERSRDIGIARAIGATPGQIVAAMALEALALTSIGLVMAIPLGELLAWFFRARVSDAVANFRFAHAFPWAAFGALVVGLPVVVLLATWAPARWALSLRVVDAISDE